MHLLASHAFWIRTWMEQCFVFFVCSHLQTQQPRVIEMHGRCTFLSWCVLFFFRFGPVPNHALSSFPTCFPWTTQALYNLLLLCVFHWAASTKLYTTNQAEQTHRRWKTRAAQTEPLRRFEHTIYTLQICGCWWDLASSEVSTAAFFLWAHVPRAVLVLCVVLLDVETVLQEVRAQEFSLFMHRRATLRVFLTLENVFFFVLSSHHASCFSNPGSSSPSTWRETCSLDWDP